MERGMTTELLTPPAPRADSKPIKRSHPARGFRPASRRRVRITVGVFVAALAVGGNLLVYSSLDHETEVLQVVRDIPAGDMVSADDLRVVAVEVDPTVPTVAPDDIGAVVNQYARVHIAAGTLMVDVFVQSAPLVALGQGVVAVEIRPTQLPAGLRERSRVMLVVVGGDGLPGLVTEGRVVSRGETSESSDNALALSVEVRQEDAAAIAAADDVRVALLDPGADPALESGA
jgi:SAF domain